MIFIYWLSLVIVMMLFFFFFSSRRRHTRLVSDWSSDVCSSDLGPGGLAATTTPASAVMRLALGPRGGAFIAAGIAFSAFGFLGQSVLTAPRVYFAMAEDGVFFRSVAWVYPRTRVPVMAIALQGLWAILIALTGTYAQVVNYVVAMDSIFFGLTALCLLLLRRRDSSSLPKIGRAHV